MAENLITVTGKGSVHIEPDVTRLDIILQSIHDSYEEAYDQAKTNTDSFTKIMSELSLDKSLPKTIRLDIDKKTQSEYDKYKNYKGEKFVGFQLDHRVKIDIGIDNVLLGKIVKLIGKYLKQAEISIGYTVKDIRAAQLKMLERAVKDARGKATVMAAACDSKLGLVKEINYSDKEIHFYSQTRVIHEAAEATYCNSESLDIFPDDKVSSDEVTVVWYLVGNDKEE